jgi:rare lipoprotein A
LLISQQQVEPYAEGVASYYTVESSSHVTASGERMRDDALTCAMLEAPFGERFLVVASNGRSVVVTCNDRGPYVGNRVIDLSRAAMRRLHPTAGLMRVEIYRLSPKAAPPDASPADTAFLETQGGG